MKTSQLLQLRRTVPKEQFSSHKAWGEADKPRKNHHRPPGPIEKTVKPEDLNAYGKLGGQFGTQVIKELQDSAFNKTGPGDQSELTNTQVVASDVVTKDWGSNGK